MPLDACISGFFEPGNIGSSSGSVTTPQFYGYLLARTGHRIGITTRTRPPGAPLTFTFEDPIYIVGAIQIRG